MIWKTDIFGIETLYFQNISLFRVFLQQDYNNYLTNFSPDGHLSISHQQNTVLFFPYQETLS